MKSEFWIDTWEKGQIGFHRDAPNPALIAHIDCLGLAQGARIFLPLCGKTRDIGWLLSRGCRVCGAELSELAIRALFDDLELTPTVVALGELTHYSAKGLDIYVGDIFTLDRGTLGPVDAVYDRAALVALPEGMRARYAAHLTALTDGASQLLVCYDYDQEAMSGPPFSVDEAQVRGFYGDGYDVTLLKRAPVPGGIKEECPALQDVWLLEKREER